MLRPIAKQRQAWWAAIAMVCAVFLTPAYAADAVSGRFALIDHRGEAVTEASYNGKYRLVFFGFTRCPVVCPTTMFEITRAMKMLGEHASRVQPIFITIDPGNDTTDVIADYVRHFHPSIVGLSGSEQQIADTAKSFNVTYGGTQAGGDNSTEIYHSSYVYLMNEEGRFLDVFGYGAKAETITETLVNHLAAPLSDLTVIEPWATKPAGTGASVIAGFMCFRNDGPTMIRIVAASSESVASVAIHEIIHDDGIVRMKKTDNVAIASNSTVCLEPDRMHFMLMGIDESIRAGADVVLKIQTASGAELETVLPQRALVKPD